ncbi:MAG: hypothetical protein WA921_10815 [Ahrensia sp.]
MMFSFSHLPSNICAFGQNSKIAFQIPMRLLKNCHDLPHHHYANYLPGLPRLITRKAGTLRLFFSAPCTIPLKMNFRAAMAL